MLEPGPRSICAPIPFRLHTHLHNSVCVCVSMHVLESFLMPCPVPRAYFSVVSDCTVVQPVASARSWIRAVVESCYSFLKRSCSCTSISSDSFGAAVQTHQDMMSWTQRVVIGWVSMLWCINHTGARVSPCQPLIHTHRLTHTHTHKLHHQPHSHLHRSALLTDILHWCSPLVHHPPTHTPPLCQTAFGKASANMCVWLKGSWYSVRANN